MTVTRVSVGEKVRAAKVNELVDEVNLMGLRGVIPTSVAGTGVAFDSTTGIITFTNATAITVNGVFSSAFRNYQIRYDSIGTAAGLNLQLRVSGSTSATGYDLTEALNRNAVSSSSTVLNQAQWALSGGTNTIHAGTVDVFVPFLSLETRIIANSGVHANPAASSTANALKTSYGTHRTATGYDGFVLTFSAAQTGVLRVGGFQ